MRSFRVYPCAICSVRFCWLLLLDSLSLSLSLSLYIYIYIYVNLFADLHKTMWIMGLFAPMWIKS
ncbi:hypothetical protein MUK42_33120 [Musa troglodytarum]|uniref:Uncharacterized protein n=1 Tax=Musa troglodytarum TaxID=320322 RepID=A0A9E7JS44_9LILI|nr:hypothetical protein MUK42_33120 [Musa troglodytarum]